MEFEKIQLRTRQSSPDNFDEQLNVQSNSTPQRIEVIYQKVVEVSSSQNKRTKEMELFRNIVSIREYK